MIIFEDKNGKFSSKKMINISFFAISCLTWAVAVVFNFLGKTIQPELFVFVAGLTGGSFFQYVYGKKVDNGG